ncbi:MAG: alcohol dehydrogenase catalytic domain-containing protein [Verrucomicrobiota bacterium]|nr:alcohol dehydrogenase catalytic domain-containing protein [Verrucomicrobiota bacterium]MDP7049444.1 alcohol dehydrogenase catalytic domain-containing protein [Verrucomicrobiota bacterium]
MKAAFFTGLRALDVLEMPKPALERPGDVLLRIDTLGVCGSDIHYYAEGRIGNQFIEHPATLGHECAGTVLDVGSDVDGLKSGQRVAIDPAISCGDCDQCLAGRAHTCRQLSFLGCPGQAPGAAAEFITVAAESCYPIPDSMTMVQAALVEPLSVAVYAVRLAETSAGGAVGILGAGPIGLSVLLAVRALCPGRTFVTDLFNNRLSLATRCGADWTGSPKINNIVTEILKEEPGGLDCVFECAGRQETLDQAVELLKPGGVLVLVGIPESERVDFRIDSLRRKELRLQNVRRQNNCTKAAIDLVASGTVDVNPLATHHFELKEIKAAFDLVADYSDGVVKAIIHMPNAPDQPR